ncbi:MAG: hypothetical protein LAO20_08335 [Acidobacteriia bacterium]|nr:hypothetical protein [Terriglobia bacterium]
MKASRISFLATLRRTGLHMAFAMGLLILTGCAAQKPLRFAPKSVSKVSYDPRNCTELPDGKFRCKDVVFTVSAVQVPRP